MLLVVDLLSAVRAVQVVADLEADLPHLPFELTGLTLTQLGEDSIARDGVDRVLLGDDLLGASLGGFTVH